MSVIDLLRDSYLEHDNPTVNVNLVEFIHTLAGSCDSGSSNPNWIDDAIFEKLSDNQMGYIIDSLLTYGFVTPLNVFTENDGRTFIMGNGHHRLIAALFCGFEEIPVYAAPYIDWKRSESNDPRLNDTENQPSIIRDLFQMYEPGLESIADAMGFNDGSYVAYSYNGYNPENDTCPTCDARNNGNGYDDDDDDDNQLVEINVEDDYIKFFEGQMYVQDCQCPECADLQARREASDLIAKLELLDEPFI